MAFAQDHRAAWGSGPLTSCGLSTSERGSGASWDADLLSIPVWNAEHTGDEKQTSGVF